MKPGQRATSVPLRTSAPSPYGCSSDSIWALSASAIAGPRRSSCAGRSAPHERYRGPSGPSDRAGSRQSRRPVIRCGHQHRPQKAVRLSRLRDRYALVKQAGTPVADHGCVDLAQRHITQVRRDVPSEQATINLDCAGTQARPLRDPHVGVVGQPDLGPVRICPCALGNFGLDQSQRTISIRLARERNRVASQPARRARDTAPGTGPKEADGCCRNGACPDRRRAIPCKVTRGQ